MTQISLSHKLGFVAIVAAGSAWDLFSKARVFDWFPPGPGNVGGPIHRLPGGWVTFQLKVSFNAGALFGMGQGLTWLFALLSLFAVAGVLYWMFGLKAGRSRWLTLALALILAGTLGNLYDRLGLHGWKDFEGQQLFAVRDFLLFTFGRFSYPVFNFADVFLVTGAVMLILKSFGREEGEEEGDGKEDGDGKEAEEEEGEGEEEGEEAD